MRKSCGILAVAVLALTGCGSSSSTQSSPEPSAATTPATEPNIVSQAKGGESICKDKAGDSASKVVDLAQARLFSDGTEMLATFNTVANVPTTGTVLYSVRAWSADGSKEYQLGAKFKDGKEIATFVVAVGSGQQENITTGAVAADKQVSGRYPLAKLEGLGDKFEWSAKVTVDDTEADRCPGGDVRSRFPGA
jgi:hypothetical protein